jgi:hypothetical protein
MYFSNWENIFIFKFQILNYLRVTTSSEAASNKYKISNDLTVQNFKYHAVCREDGAFNNAAN